MSVLLQKKNVISVLISVIWYFLICVCAKNSYLKYMAMSGIMQE